MNKVECELKKKESILKFHSDVNCCLVSNLYIYFSTLIPTLHKNIKNFSKKSFNYQYKKLLGIIILKHKTLKTKTKFKSHI